MEQDTRASGENEGILGWVLEKEHSFEIATVGNKIWSKLGLNSRIPGNTNQRG